MTTIVYRVGIVATDTLMVGGEGGVNGIFKCQNRRGG